MKLKLLYILLAIVVTAGTVTSQNEDELHIPIETDNQFPPDHSESEGIIEGSGNGAVDEPIVDSTTESRATPILESIEGLQTSVNEGLDSGTVSNSTQLPCPKPCVCNTEGDTANYIVDCSGYGLTEFPSPIDPRTTTLKLHNNKLTEIPKSISELKSLKVLNASNNLIMDLALGSVSELPELVILKLSNNRLIEYPKDLKNSISLSKLEELDLGGNDMRSVLSSETFSNFKALRKITLPAVSSTDLSLDLCNTLKKTLETVCMVSCDTKMVDCPDAPQIIEDDLLAATLPGMIPYEVPHESKKGSVENTENSEKENVSTTTSSTTITPSTTTSSSSPTTTTSSSTSTTPTSTTSLETNPNSNDNIAANEFSLRTAVNDIPEHKVAAFNVISDPTKESSTEEAHVKVGATTSISKAGGGVDKSVIGIVVAGMIVIVAGITIKKNWSSIKKRFTSTPNRAADRQDANANGTAPEEVPLQDKSDKSPV
ncbi:unnamed protein product [Euphydryas editha]|uniref:LRRNT domain-containing protein n=1 Tax=Euphydryas editha TaxID=104508 RepID=A0AAU9U8C6_EUPED|nr:unnamed protein product [Euphydryas editha]